jgi:hypothetical protein
VHDVFGDRGSIREFSYDVLLVWMKPGSAVLLADLQKLSDRMPEESLISVSMLDNQLVVSVMLPPRSFR